MWELLCNFHISLQFSYQFAIFISVAIFTLCCMVPMWKFEIFIWVCNFHINLQFSYQFAILTSRLQHFLPTHTSCSSWVGWSTSSQRQRPVVRCINIQERQRSPQPLPLGALVLAGLEGSALWLPLWCRPHTTFKLSLYVVGYHINRLLLFCRVFHIPMSKVWLSSPNTFVTNSFLLGCPAPSWADGISWPPKSWVWPPTCLIILFSLHDWGVPSKEACAADDVAIFVWCCCFYQAHILCSGQYQRKQSIQFYWRRSVHGDS